jgi:hypothetical protein
MSNIVNQTPIVTWEMDISGPVPMRWYITDNAGVPAPRPADILCELTYLDTPPVLLTLGSGIVLETVDGVANAQVKTTPTTAQLADYPVGATVTAEWRENTPGEVVLRGNLIMM